tara:strand:+ start:52 stop:729 length:678 start_codon:yes stop_codon:yes gene_type:complete
MAFLPISCIDNFFELPDKVRDYALTADNLNWQPSLDGAWPGVRSVNLEKVNIHLFREICARYLHIFFSQEQMKRLGFRATMYFQKVEEDYYGGWIHNDYPSIHTSIIYLTPNVSLDSGTSMYQLKSLTQTDSDDIKNKLYLGKITKEEAEKYRIEHNNQYEQTVHYSNIYNRCISFDGNVHHGAGTFENKKERLTLIIFWDELSSVTNFQYTKSIPQGVQFGKKQ